MKDKKFYVYELRDSCGNVLYVGKGSNGRMHVHCREALNGRNGESNCHRRLYRKIRNLYSNDLCVNSVKVFETNEEDKSLLKEVELISRYGRLDIRTGILYNQTNGGDGVSGLNMPKGKNSKNFGKKRSEECRLKMRLAKLGKPGNRLGSVASEETRKKQSLAKLGKSTWNKGKKFPGKVNSGSFKKGEHRSPSTEFKKENSPP